MSNALLDQVIEEVKLLPPDDQRRVRDILDELLRVSPITPGELLSESLLQAGLLSEIKPPLDDFSQYENRKLIEVQGKPVSETIIEERG